MDLRFTLVFLFIIFGVLGQDNLENEVSRIMNQCSSNALFFGKTLMISSAAVAPLAG